MCDNVTEKDQSLTVGIREGPSGDAKTQLNVLA